MDTVRHVAYIAMGAQGDSVAIRRGWGNLQIDVLWECVGVGPMSPRDVCESTGWRPFVCGPVPCFTWGVTTTAAYLRSVGRFSARVIFVILSRDEE